MTRKQRILNRLLVCVILFRFMIVFDMLLCKYSEMRVFSTAELFRVDGQIITSTPQICQRIK